MDSVTEKLAFDWEELTANHPYVEPYRENGVLFHGGFLADGRYEPPRTFGRRVAINRWAENLKQRGVALVDCSRQTHPHPAYPNAAQYKLLLRHGVHRPLWDALTTTAIQEGKGSTFCVVPFSDFQSFIQEDISETATGHLWKGLFWAHGVDEAGDPKNSAEGGHKQMWLAVRDMLLPEAQFERPSYQLLITRPIEAEREIPALPQAVEKLIVTCMSLLQVEIKSFTFAEVCIEILQDTEIMAGRSDDAKRAALIVERVCIDEMSHIDYLQVFISELRNFTIIGQDGSRQKGASIIDPVWQRLLAWPEKNAYIKKWTTTRRQIADEVVLNLGFRQSVAIMKEFDALGPLLTD